MHFNTIQITIMQFCVITVEVSLAENLQWKSKNALTAGCQQSWWRCRSRSSAVGKNFPAGRGSFASVCVNWNCTMIVLDVVLGVWAAFYRAWGRGGQKLPGDCWASKSAKKEALRWNVWSESSNMWQHNVSSFNLMGFFFTLQVH